jgi:hypothetical protein
MLSMTLGHCGGNAFLVVGAVRGKRGHRCRHLVEQGANLGAVIDVVGGQRHGDNLAILGIHADVQLAPGPACFGAVLLQQPLARAAKLQAGAVHQQVDSLALLARSWPWHLQRPGSTAQGGVVGHRQSQPEQVKNGADQPFRLA